MKQLSLPTALVLIATIVCVTVLVALGKPIPASISGLVGSVLSAVLPALLGANPSPATPAETKPK